MAEKSEELTFLGKVLAVVGAITGFSLVMNESGNVGGALVAGMIGAAVGGFVGNLLTRVLIIGLGVAILVMRLEAATGVEVSGPVVDPLIGNSERHQVLLDNKCRHPIQLVARYRKENGAWTSKGYWNIDGDKRTYLASGDSRIVATSSEFFYYARITASQYNDYSWSGDYNKLYDGEWWPMRRVNDTLRPTQDIVVTLNCNNLG